MSTCQFIAIASDPSHHSLCLLHCGNFQRHVVSNNISTYLTTMSTCQFIAIAASKFVFRLMTINFYENCNPNKEYSISFLIAHYTAPSNRAWLTETQTLHNTFQRYREKERTTIKMLLLLLHAHSISSSRPLLGTWLRSFPRSTLDRGKLTTAEYCLIGEPRNFIPAENFHVT